MPLSIKRVALGYILLALPAAAGGCQKKQAWNLGTVEGTVTKGGHPLARIQVAFLADIDAGTQGVRASGITDEAGHYQIQTDNGDPGAVVGKNRVLLIDTDAAMAARLKGKKGRKRPGAIPTAHVPLPKELEKNARDAPRVPPPYGSFKETPLRVEVHSGSQTLDFDIP